MQLCRPFAGHEGRRRRKDGYIAYKKLDRLGDYSDADVPEYASGEGDGAILCQSFYALCKDNEKIIEEFLENLSKSLEYRKHEKEQRDLNAKINKLDKQRNQLVDLLLEQKIKKEIYDKKYERVSQEIEVAEQELQTYNDSNEFGDDFGSRLTSFKRIFEKKELMDKFDGEIFRTLVKEVFIDDTAQVGTPLPYTINFVFKTGLKINILPLFPKEPPQENDHAR